MKKKTRMLLITMDELLNYVGYDPIHLDNPHWQGVGSIGAVIEQYGVRQKPISRMVDLKPEEQLVLSTSQSYQSAVESIAHCNINKLRSLIVDEGGFQLNNQSLEYLCSGGQLEELVIGDTLHTLTTLPWPHLSKLKHLFICEDSNVSIDDKDLARISQLQILTLSNNKQITVDGLSQLASLFSISLYNNELDYRLLPPQITNVAVEKGEYGDPENTMVY